MNREKGYLNDDADGLLSGDPTQTPQPAKGMDSSFNDPKGLDIGDDTQTPSEPSDSGSIDEGNGKSGFNDNPNL